MKLSLVRDRIDIVIRFCLYGLIFWVPYSPAAIEICVVISCVLWLIKRAILTLDWQFSGKGWKENISHVIKSFKPKENILNLPIFIFLVVCVISALNSEYTSRSLSGLFTKTLEWFVIYLLVLEVFTKKKHIYTALSVFVATALATCLDSLLQYHITGKDLFNGRELATDRMGATAGFRHPNSLGAFLTIFLPFTLSVMLLRVKKGWQKIALVLPFIAAGWSVVITYSRGAWFGVICGVLFTGFFLSRKTFVRCLIVAIVVMVCFSAFYGGGENAINRISEYRPGTAVWRLFVWEDSFKMIKEKPMLGHGINTFMMLFEQYKRKGIIPTYAHNCYIQMAVEVGILGLMPFLWIIFLLFQKPLRLISNKPGIHENLRVILIGLLGGMFAFLVHSFFDVDFYSLQLSAYFWFITGIFMCTYRLLNDSLTN